MNLDLARYYPVCTTAQEVYDSIRDSKGPREAAFRCIKSIPTSHDQTISNKFIYG